MEFAPLLAEESGLIQAEVSIVLLLSLAALVAIVIGRHGPGGDDRPRRDGALAGVGGSALGGLVGRFPRDRGRS